MRERRQVPRYVAELHCEVSQPPGATPHHVKLVNLSVLGCSVEGADALQAKQDCEIAFEWGGHQFRAEATVTWKSSRGEAGLKFLSMDPAHQDVLRKLCANLRPLPLGRLPDAP